MKTPEETRVYVVIAGTIRTTRGVITQPPGRQVAQACHVVSKLRIEAHNGTTQEGFEPMTTIVLQARDSAEMDRVFDLLLHKKLRPVIFDDNNPEYGAGDWPTAVAVFATSKQVRYILDYLPLWGGGEEMSCPVCSGRFFISSTEPRKIVGCPNCGTRVMPIGMSEENFIRQALSNEKEKSRQIDIPFERSI